MKRMLLVAALVVFPVMSVLASSPAKKPLEEGKPYAEQRQRIMSDLQEGEVYSEISLENRSRVLASLGRIDALLGEDGQVQRLSELERVAMFNDQEEINALLTEAREDSRLICRRERPIGSHRPQNICITAAMRRQAQENAREELRKMPVSQSRATTP